MFQIDKLLTPYEKLLYLGSMILEVNNFLPSSQYSKSFYLYNLTTVNQNLFRLG